MDNLIKVYEGSNVLVNRAADLLEENGIPSLIKDHAESARLAGFGTPQNSVELFVPADKAEMAFKVMADLND
jgi:hypothetical protein